jgi:type 1 glutamine amidotransferase
MKRKLISFDAFKKIEEASLTNAQEELIGAEEVLARTLGVDDLKLFTFGESDVTYQAPDGSFVHANYNIDGDQLVLEQIEQLVIEQESEKKNARQILVNMVDSLLENNDAKAGQLFESYLEMPFVRRELLVSEGFKVTVSKPTGKFSKLRHKKQNRSLVAKRVRSRAKTLAKTTQSQKDQLKRKRGIASKKLGASSNPRWRTYARKIKPATMKEWAVMCENVMDYIDYKEFGPVLAESSVQTDDRGNITGVAMPIIQKRNEGKILTFNWKTMDHEVKVLRGQVKKLAEDQTFVKAMTDLKRYNNISDNSSLEETLEAIVTRWPDVLYVTEEELASQISNALETASVTNYDDSVCAFMAEAILRTAHNAYTDRTRKIGTLAGATTDITSECKTCEDSYKEFKTVADKFFATLDETDSSDFKVFEDLFNALHEVYKVAHETQDEATKSEVENYMHECAAILNRESQIDLDLAEDISNYLNDLVESNVTGAEDTWKDTPIHHTINGDHPKMAWNAQQTDAVASKYYGDYSDEAPVSDGKSYKNGLADEMKSKSWGNIANADTYPDMNNPYVPKPYGDFKMKEKSAVDDGSSDWSRFQSDDTWPSLKNPYVPKSEIPVNKT